MRPEVGCRIPASVFAHSHASTAGTLAYEVKNSRLRWEPLVNVVKVDVRPDPRDATTMLIDIRYVIKFANDPRNLVFPFYTIPPEEGSPALEASTAGSLEE